MKPILLAAALGAVVIGGAATAQTLSTNEVLAQARALSFEIREGRYDAAPEALTLVEQALKSDPENSRLQTAYALANFQMATASSQLGTNPVQAVPFIFKGAGAYEKAAALDPQNADAVAGRGAARSIVGLMQGKMDMVAAGSADMTRAVELAPKATNPRLQRAFFGLNTPKAARNDQAIETDLKQLIALGTPREQDHLHALLGDLYAEAGKADLARSEYDAANRAGSTSALMAQERLKALAAGKVDAGAIASLRSQLGSNCAMCHAR